MRLLLASASPRRRELLDAAGLSFDVAAVDIDERRLPGEPPNHYVARLAAEKAAKAATRFPDRVVIAADTAVVLGEDDVLGKPSDAADASRMLKQLSGRSHDVLTGVAAMAGGASATSVERTRVWFDTLTDEDIAAYVASGEPMDKAGAYAIQGLASRFIPRIDGSYSNVVGLPVTVVVALLRQLGVEGVS